MTVAFGVSGGWTASAAADCGAAAAGDVRRRFVAGAAGWGCCELAPAAERDGCDVIVAAGN